MNGSLTILMHYHCGYNCLWKAWSKVLLSIFNTSNLFPPLILFQMWNPKRIVKSNHPYNPPIKLCTALRRSKVCLFFCHGLWSLGLTQKEGLHSGTNHRPTPWPIWLCPTHYYDSIRHIFIHSVPCVYRISPDPTVEAFCHCDPNFRSPLTIWHCIMDIQWVRRIAGIFSALKVNNSVLIKLYPKPILWFCSASMDPHRHGHS